MVFRILRNLFTLFLLPVILSLLSPGNFCLICLAKLNGFYNFGQSMRVIDVILNDNPIDIFLIEFE